MTIKIISGGLPKDAMTVRQTVFVEEQGFVDDEDEVDAVAVHLVTYDGDKAVATCRVFASSAPAEYLLGRFAVLKDYRGGGVGRELLGEAERCAREQGACRLSLHSQYHAKGFYERFGYIPHGDIEYEQDQPHIAMTKQL